MNKQFKFAIYTSFYNASRYIDRIYENIMSINYLDFTWFITDDFSTDDTKQKLLNKIKNNKKIIYVEQNHKMEMYWQPNKFIPIEYEYVLLVDSDDLVDKNILSVYNNLIKKHDNISIVTCDFMRISDTDSSVHSIGYILNQESLIDKLKHYHPQIDYCHNLSYYCFGHGRCFKNIKNFKFDVNTFNDVCEDSYRMLYMTGYGNWLHVPRNLYTWTIRNDSISSIKSTEHSLTYNKNFDIGLQKSKSSNNESVYCYNSCYKELNSMMFFGINTNFKNISIISQNLDVVQKEKIKEVYIDKNVVFNHYTDSECYLIILNHFNDNDTLLDTIKRLKSMNKNMEINMYYLNDSKYLNVQKMNDDMINKLTQYENILKFEFKNYNYYYYIRHLNFKIYYKN